MSKENGGPAFPCEMPGPGHGKAGPSRTHYYGISVRDYFAVAALQRMKIEVAFDWVPRRLSEVNVNWEPDELAAQAYRFADAMLAERDK